MLSISLCSFWRELWNSFLLVPERILCSARFALGLWCCRTRNKASGEHTRVPSSAQQLGRCSVGSKVCSGSQGVPGFVP